MGWGRRGAQIDIQTRTRERGRENRQTGKEREERKWGKMHRNRDMKHETETARQSQT